MTELSKTNVSKIFINTFYDAKTRSSFCWKYFGHLVIIDSNKKKILNSNQIYCLACLTAVKKESEDITFGSVKIKSYNKTVSTGNLIRHLRDNHQISADKSIASPKDFITATRPTKTSTECCSKESSKYDKWFLARDLALWFCKSLLPFDYVSDEGMVEFFKKYNLIVTDDDLPSRVTDDDLPSRRTVGGSALSDVYESVLNKVKENIFIDGAMHFAITYDLWTHQNQRLSYITFTLHYLTSDFNFKTFTLGTNVLTGVKTEERIKYTIQDVKKRFALDDKNIVAVIDSGVNIKRAVKLENTNHHLCLGYGLHKLVVIDGINTVPEIAALLQKVQNLVKAIRYSTLELEADAEKKQRPLEFLSSLERVVEAIENDESDPISEDKLKIHESNDEFDDSLLASVHSKHTPIIKTGTPTRWHCIIEMLESVILACHRELINEMLRNIDQAELEITQDEWILLEDLVQFLNSLHEAVEIMSSQKTCTMNVALVFRSEIIDVLNTVQDKESQIILHLKRNMLANINKRFPVSKLIVAAALLDCRFMSLKEVSIFLEKHNMTKTSFLSSYVKEVISINNIPETTSSNDDNDASLLHKLSKKHSTSACHGIQDDPIEQECWRYIAAADPMEPKGDLLSYWNSKKEAFPFLSSLAKALLCVHAISTPSERMFSTSGLEITARRSRLCPNTVNKIIFIHDNYKTCEIDIKIEK